MLSVPLSRLNSVAVPSDLAYVYVIDNTIAPLTATRTTKICHTCVVCGH